MKLLGISAGPKKTSKTLIAVNTATSFAKQHDENTDVEVINICDYNIEFCDARDPKSYTGDTKTVIDKIIEADAYIYGTPIYRGTYTGILKNMFDLIPNDAMCGKPVGIIATAGSHHHYLALEHELKPIFGFFMAMVLPGMVYAVNNDYDGKQIISSEVLDNLKRMGMGIVNIHKVLPKDRELIIGAKGTFI